MKEVIKEMEIYAKDNNVPIIEKDSIEFIKKYIELNHVKSILEIGTAIGYSAIQMASVSNDIQITTLERDDKRYMEAIKNVKKCEMEKRIEVVFQDALDVNLVGREYDLIFIDAAKGQYIKFFEKFSNYLAQSGVIITDNIKFHGLVYNDSDELTKNQRSIASKIEAYIEFLKENQDFATKIYDIGDGLSVSIRKKDENK